MSAGVYRMIGGPENGKLRELPGNDAVEVHRAGDLTIGEPASVVAGHYVPHPSVKQVMTWKPLRVGEVVEAPAPRIQDVDMTFVRLVRDLRATQMEYFKARDREVLLRSKALEKEVDRRIQWLLKVGGGE